VYDVALDEDGDLRVENDAAALVSDDAAVAQGIYLRLSLWRREYGRDERVGMRFGDLLGRKGAVAEIAEEIRTAIATAPGVDAVVSFAYEHDAARRHLAVTYQVRAVSGNLLDPATFTPFVAEAA
jgi:hypothetical protein